MPLTHFSKLVVVVFAALVAGTGLAQGVETTQIVPQNAGRVLQAYDNATFHERANLPPIVTNESGPPGCIVTKQRSGDVTRRSRLVAVLDMARDVRLPRDYLWNVMRPTVLDIAEKICPGTMSVEVLVYAKGWDVTAAGDAYRIEDAEMPFIQKVDLETSEIRNGVVVDSQTFMGLVGSIVSDGIVAATFNSPERFAALGIPCETNCTFETFAPRYQSAMPGDIIFISQLQNLAKQTGRPFGELLGNRYKPQERSASFDGQVAAQKAHYENDARIREERRETIRFATQLQELADSLTPGQLMMGLISRWGTFGGEPYPGFRKLQDEAVIMMIR